MGEVSSWMQLCGGCWSEKLPLQSGQSQEHQSGKRGRVSFWLHLLLSSYHKTACGAVGTQNVTFLLPSEDLRCVWIPDTCKRGRSCNQVPSVSAPQRCLAGRELEALSPGPHVGEVRPFTDPHGHWLEPEVLAPRPRLFPSGRASSLSLTCWCLPRPLNPVLVAHTLSRTCN